MHLAMIRSALRLSAGLSFSPSLHAALTAQFEQEHGRRPSGEHELFTLLKEVVGIGANAGAARSIAEPKKLSAIAHEAFEKARGAAATTEAEALALLHERLQLDAVSTCLIWRSRPDAMMAVAPLVIPTHDPARRLIQEAPSQFG